MKEKIHNLSPEVSQKILTEFLDVYLDKGFGVMNKSDIETLLYSVLWRNELLTGKCFDDSFDLQITEAKARKLIYESQIKYGTRDRDDLIKNLRMSVGRCLSNAYISKNNKVIKFAVEDKYLRVALNAHLRKNEIFADTSFNTEIVSLDEKAFAKMIEILVPNFQKNDILAKVKDENISDETRSQTGMDFLSSLAKELIINVSVNGIHMIGKWLVQL